MRRFFLIFALSSAVALSYIGGCRQTSRTIKTTEFKPIPCKDKIISADCIVTFYGPESGKYLSPQRHKICPAPGSIAISADEPQGRLVLQLSEKGFELTLPQTNPSEFSKTMQRPNITECLLTSILAGAGFIDTAAGVELDPTRIQGQWYKPIELNPVKLTRPSRTIFKNNDTSLTDLVHVKDPAGDTIFIARSYNYRWFEEIDRFIPMKIDISTTSPNTETAQLLLQINYHNVKILQEN
jgi:hypothetical protein